VTTKNQKITDDEHLAQVFNHSVVLIQAKEALI